MGGVQYDLLSGVGPASFLVYGTMTAHAWVEPDETGETAIKQFVSFGWRWTLTDLDGNPLGKSNGRIVDFGVDEGAPRLVHNWQGVCIEP